MPGKTMTAKVILNKNGNVNLHSFHETIASAKDRADEANKNAQALGISGQYEAVELPAPMTVG